MSKAVGNLAGFFSREAQPQLICLFTVHSAVSASPWAFLTCRQKRWCVSQGQAGRMCRGGQRLLGMEPVPVCATPGREPCPHTCGRSLPGCHSLLCTSVCFPRGQEGSWPCQPQPRPPGSAFCGNGVSQVLVTCRAGGRWQARAWRLLVSSVRWLITAVNCRSQGRGPAGAPPSLHSLLFPPLLPNAAPVPPRRSPGVSP